MSSQIRGLLNIAIVGLLTILYDGCMPAPDPPTPHQTRILQVEVDPDPVAAGDTATFTCIIEDSTDPRFKIKWLFGKNSAKDTVTEENSVQWIAPDTAGVFAHVVEVFNESQDSIPPNRPFEVQVTEN